jgi:hypothetical protein
VQNVSEFAALFPQRYGVFPWRWRNGHLGQAPQTADVTAAKLIAPALVAEHISRPQRDPECIFGFVHESCHLRAKFVCRTVRIVQLKQVEGDANGRGGSLAVARWDAMDELVSC